jgi:hypothetical protein
MTTGYKPPAKFANLSIDQLKAEIDRLRAEVYKPHINEFRGFSWAQTKALTNLFEIRDHLLKLAQADLQ